MIGELTLYTLTAGGMLFVTLLISGWVLRKPPAYRRFLLPIPCIVGVLVLSYGAMSQEFLTVPDSEGTPVTTARFLGYFFTYPIVVLYLGWLVDATRRQTFLGSGLVILFTLAVLSNWFLEGVLTALASLLLVGSLAVLLWIMFRPMTRAGEAVSMERRLTFWRLRNLLALIWIFYLLVGLTSRQGLGLLDTFTGVLIGTYLDALGHIGFAVLLLRADATLQSLNAGYSSFREYLVDGTNRR